ncbi:MAG TPA: hypothetical protein VMW25_00030 [Clostridia bacterium]|nr:hypothetical protein [Clostridia bacterium]
MNWKNIASLCMGLTIGQLFFFLLVEGKAVAILGIVFSLIAVSILLFKMEANK